MVASDNHSKHDDPLPPKSAEISNHHTDSRRWDNVKFRDDDVIVASYPKSGTTWTQNIVRILLGIPMDSVITDQCPWVDKRLVPEETTLRMVEALQHRRSLKSHLPQTCLPTASRDKASFIYVARDGRDVCWSLFDFHRSFKKPFIESLNQGSFNGPQFPEDDSVDVVEYFQRWLECDGYPFWPFWEHIRSWWRVRNNPRVLLVHYAVLKRTPSKEIARMYDFLERFGEMSKEEKTSIVENAVQNSTFEAMKRNGTVTTPKGGTDLKNGPKSFFNKGINARWKSVLPEKLVLAYNEIAVRELGPECAHWLATGEFNGQC